MFTVFNFVTFQIGWFACVLGAAYGYSLFGSAVTALIVTVHLLLIARPRRELLLLLAAGLGGWLWESLLVHAGLTEFSAGTLLPGTAPHWLAALWVLFAMTLNHSLSWLRGRPVLATLFGAVGGPLSYLAGQRLGAVEFSDPTTALLTLSLAWAVLTPALLALAASLERAPVRRALPAAAGVQ